MKKRVSIKEAAKISGLTVTTIYRYINNNKLTCYNMKKHGKTTKEIDLEELSRLLEIDLLKPDNNMEKHVNNSYSHDNNSESHVNTLTIENLNEAIQKAIQEQQQAIIKPIEQQALFLAGKYQAENEFLRQQVETLRNELDAVKALPVDIAVKEEENKKLQEQLKTLPAEVEKVNEMLKLSSEKLLQVDEEKQKLQEENNKISTILMQNADNISILQKQKDDIQKKLQQEQEHMKSEIQKLRDELTKAEADKIEIANTWKKELEDARRPWYKFW